MGVPLVTKDLMDSSGINLIEDGWFEERSFASCYKQKPSVCNDSHVKEDDIENPAGHVMNSFGYLRSPWNMHAGEHVIRSQKMCGESNNVQFPDCTAIVTNQEDYTDFANYVINLQLSPHGTVHVFTGGAFGDCTDTYLDLKSSL